MTEPSSDTAKASLWITTRVARNTAFGIAADVASKLALVGLFAVVARELGRGGLGDLVFAVSIGFLLTSFAGLGTDEIVAREIVREPAALRRLVSNAVALKIVSGLPALLALAVVGIAVTHDASLRLAILLVGASSLLDILTATGYAAFQGLGDLAPEARARTIQNGGRALIGVAVLTAGGGVAELSCVYLATSLAALVYTSRLLRGRVRLRSLRPAVSSMRWLAFASLPIGLAGIFELISTNFATMLLAFLQDNEAVGLFGAAVRLVDGGLVLGSAFVAAMLPALAEAARSDARAMRAVYGTGVKAVTLVVLPIGVGIILFAEPLSRLIFGPTFSQGTLAVQILAAMILLKTLSWLSSTALIAAGHERLIPRIAGVSLLAGGALLLILIPRYSVNGAAVAVVASTGTFALASTAAVLRVTGPISLPRIGAASAIACLAMVGAALAMGQDWGAVPVAAGVYAAVALGLERLLYPEDLGRVTVLLLGRRARRLFRRGE